MRDRSPVAPPSNAWAAPAAGGPGQAGGARPAAPGERLPQPPRERKPALAALAVLLILGGALGSATLVLRSGKTTAVIEVARNVPAGVHLSAADLREAQVSDPDGAVKTIPWGQRASVLQYYAAAGLIQGSLLVPAMVSADGASRAGTLTIGLSLSAGQMPAGLREGDHIRLYSTDPATPAPQRVLTTAIIVKTSSSSSGSSVGGSGGDMVITVIVGEDVAPAVLLASKAGNIVVALLPAGSDTGTPAQPAAPSTPTAASTPTAKA